jgi:TRAP-type transport system small permease protein
MSMIETGAVPSVVAPAGGARIGARKPWRGVVWLSTNLEEMICVAFLVVLVGSVFAGVFYRYFLQAPLSWSDELAQFSVVWLTFVGSALATKHNGHMLVDFVVVMLPKRAQLVVALLVNFVVLAFLVLFFSLSVQYVRKMWVAMSPALSINMGYVYLALPVGSVLIIVHLARQTLGIAQAAAAARRG